MNTASTAGQQVPPQSTTQARGGDCAGCTNTGPDPQPAPSFALTSGEQHTQLTIPFVGCGCDTKPEQTAFSVGPHGRGPFSTHFSTRFFGSFNY